MKYAYNDNGVLRDVVMTHPGILFYPDYASLFIEVPDDAQNGWVWDGEKATPPIEPTFPIEQKAIQARLERNQLLSESDWTQLADAPVDRAAWATYRQQLRDVTSQSGFPTEINWPQRPDTPNKTLFQRIGSLFSGQ